MEDMEKQPESSLQFAQFNEEVFVIFGKTYRQCNFWRSRDKLVRNYYSEGTLKRLAGCHEMFGDYLGRHLAGD